MGDTCSSDSNFRDAAWPAGEIPPGRNDMFGYQNKLKVQPADVPMTKIEFLTGSWEITQETREMQGLVKEACENRAKRRDPKKLLKDDKYATSQYLKLKNDNGDYYEGYCLDKRPHGWGFLLTRGGEYFEGEFSNGNLVKHTRHIYNDGSIYEGDYKNGRNGRGILYKDDGSVVKCNNWEFGITTLPSVIEKPEGNVIFRGFKDAKERKQGRCLLVEKGFNIEATFKDDILIGPATLLYSDGSRYDGAVDAKYEPEGQGVLIFTDGRKFAGPFSKGKAHGRGIFTPSGADKGTEQDWANGKRV